MGSGSMKGDDRDMTELEEQMLEALELALPWLKMAHADGAFQYCAAPLAALGVIKKMDDTIDNARAYRAQIRRKARDNARAQEGQG